MHHMIHLTISNTELNETRSGLTSTIYMFIISILRIDNIKIMKKGTIRCTVMYTSNVNSPLFLDLIQLALVAHC